MTISRDPISIYGALGTAASQLGGWDEAGEVIGKSGKWVRDASNPTDDLEGRPGNTLTYAHVRSLTRTKECTAFLDDLARLAGAQLIPVPNLPTNGTLHGGLGALGKEVGEAIIAVSDALTSGPISPNQRSNMLAELLHVQSATASLIALLQNEESK